MSDWTPFAAFEAESGSTDRNGLETIQLGYHCRTRDDARFWVPDELSVFGLPIVRRGYRREWGEIVGAGGRQVDTGKEGAFRLDLTLEGVKNPQDGENGVQFDADGTTSEDDAESHPDLPFLFEKYEGSIEDNKLVFSLTLRDELHALASNFEEGGEEVKNPLFGFKKYYVAGVIWTKTYVTTRPAPSVTLRLGKINHPPPSTDGYLPDLHGRRNWLKVIGKPTWRGNIWKVTEAWLMSADGGWNEDVYR